MKAFVSSLLLGLAATVCAASPAKKKYDGHKVVRVPYTNEVKALISNYTLSTWVKEGGNIDVVLPPGARIFDHISKTVMHEDLGASIAEETSFNSYAVGSASASWFKSYHPYADHLQFLNDLVASYPSNSEIVTIGNSLQGRPITGIHLFGSSGKGKKPAVVIHGTVHAREWISTMTTEYFAYNLLSNYTQSAEIKGFVDKYDFYVIPVVNPDGFVYTQSSDRLWRKNRQTTSGSSCLGHDINRNWNYQWSVTGGASTDPCEDDYRGAAAGDAPETKVLAAHLASLEASQGVQLYIDYHSYSQLFMTPYGYSCSALPPNNTFLQSLAKGAVAAIKAVYGTVFKSGNICNVIYKATGSSVDYAQDVIGVKYNFAIELRDTGNYGFVLPANQIVPTGVESYAGLRYLLLNMT